MVPDEQGNVVKKSSLFRWVLSLAVFFGGLGLSALASRLIENKALPTVPDPLLERLPYENLYIYGEILFWVYLAVAAYLLIRQKTNLSYAILLVGCFYLVRAIFLILLPLGLPHGAPLFEDRWHLYPLPYAYFPSGHIGLMTMLALLTQTRSIRIALGIFITLFAFGTMLARAHYVADLIGAVLIVYAIYTFAEKHIKNRWRLNHKAYA